MAKQPCFMLVRMSDYGKTTLFYVSQNVRLWQNNLVLRWSECQTMAKQPCFTLVGMSDYGKTTLFYVGQNVRLWQNNLVLRWSECQTMEKQLFYTFPKYSKIWNKNYSQKRWFLNNYLYLQL